MTWQEFIKEFQKNPQLRLGQFFCNKFNVKDPALFYSKDNKRSEEIIWEKYVSLLSLLPEQDTAEG